MKSSKKKSATFHNGADSRYYISKYEEKHTILICLGQDYDLPFINWLALVMLS